jgi:hypothetical protein
MGSTNRIPGVQNTGKQLKYVERSFPTLYPRDGSRAQLDAGGLTDTA